MYSWVDLTRASAENLRPALSGFLAARNPGGVGNTIECVVRSDQVIPEFPGWDITWTELPPDVTDESVSAEAYKRLTDDVYTGTGFVVASFRASVKSIAEALRIARGNVEHIPLGQFVTSAGQQTPADGWDDSFLPREEAIDALVSVLHKAGISLRMTDIRKPLAAHDGRFQKREGTFGARPRFMSLLISLAKAKGYVSVVSNKENEVNPLVRLTPEGRQYAQSHESGGSSIAGTEVATADVPADNRDNGSQSDAYITILRRASFGPFQEVRLAIYEEMEKLAGEQRHTAVALVRDAVSRVREARSADLVHSGKPFPWAKARAFMTALVSRVPIFMSDNSVVQHVWTDSQLGVDGLIPDWQLALDGELLCFLLEHGATISLDDIPALAGALYNSRHDEYFDRVLSVVGYLVSKGRVINSPSNPLEIMLVLEK